MNPSKDKNPTALRRQGLHDGFDLAQRLACVQLSFDIAVALQQLKVCDGFETHHLVAPGIVDHQVAGDGEQVSASCGDIFPIFGGEGAGHDLCHHVVKLMGGREYPPEPTAKGGFLRKNYGLEPV